MSYDRSQLPERLATRINVDHATGCWLWSGAITGNGYACIWADGRPANGHRLIYTTLIGSIPDSLQLDHLCMVKRCVNPAHLEPVTSAENTRRALVANGPTTHCKRGHVLSDDNVGTSNGRHRCKTCRNKWFREYRKTHARTDQKRATR